MNQPTEAESTQPPAAEPPPSEATGERERPRLGNSVGKAACRLGNVLSNGDRAALRRIAPDAPFTPVLWSELHELSQHDAPSWMGRTREKRQNRWERRWATLLMSMAFCARPQESNPRKRHLHDYNAPLGTALFNAGGGSSPGWSELRFVRLLRSKGETLEVELRRVAQYLASKSQTANWADVANLLFYQPGDDFSSISQEKAERYRLSIARDYYSAKHRSEQQRDE